MLLNQVPAGSSQTPNSCLRTLLLWSVGCMAVHSSFLSPKILLLSFVIKLRCVRFTARGALLVAWTPGWPWMKPNTKSWPYLLPYGLLCNVFLKLDCMVLKNALYRWQYWAQCQWLDLLVRLCKRSPSLVSFSDISGESNGTYSVFSFSFLPGTPRLNLFFFSSKFVF